MLHQATICEVCRSSIFIGFLRVGPVVCLTLSPPPLLFSPRSMPSPSVRSSGAGEKRRNNNTETGGRGQTTGYTRLRKASPGGPPPIEARKFDEFPAATSRSISLSSPPEGALNQQQGIGHRRGDSRAESRTACRPSPPPPNQSVGAPLCRLR